jgi:hypothetical protein
VAPDSDGKKGDAVGLSFFIHPRGEATIIGHTGSQAGFRAFLYFNPQSRNAVIAAYNTSNFSRGAATAASSEVIELARGLLVKP